MYKKNEKIKEGGFMTENMFLYGFLNVLLGIALVLFVLILSLLYKGFDRKLSARLTARVGPPITQPFRDVKKLMIKESITPENAVSWIFNAMPVLSFASSLLLVLYVPFGPFKAPYGFYGDIILVIYLLTVQSLAMTIGGFASGSPFATIGAQREMVLIMSYEIPLAITCVGVAWILTPYSSAPFSLNEIFANPVWSYVGIVGFFGLILLMIMLLIAMPAELSKIPFDIAEAETEIAGGVLAEYSGRNLAMFYLSDAVRGFVMVSIFVAIFLPYNISPLLFSELYSCKCPMANLIVYAVDILFFLFKVLVVYFFFVTVVRTSFARLKIDQASRLYWGLVFILGILGLVLLWIDRVI